MLDSTDRLSGLLHQLGNPSRRGFPGHPGFEWLDVHPDLTTAHQANLPAHIRHIAILDDLGPAGLQDLHGMLDDVGVHTTPTY